ncbi:MAG: HAD-IA family hydrolase, partial [Pseudomonadota bacterium]
HCLRQMNCDELSDRENKYLLSAWERMPAWPEAPAALSRLQDHFFLSPLTILSLRVAAHSSRFAGLTWDAIISCDALGVTKPHPESYRRALAAIGRSGDEVLFVAAHPSDLRAAREHGMKTAYVIAHLFDYGDDYKDTGFAQEFDVVAADFSDLAEQILARA